MSYPRISLNNKDFFSVADLINLEKKVYVREKAGHLIEPCLAAIICLILKVIQVTAVSFNETTVYRVNISVFYVRNWTGSPAFIRETGYPTHHWPVYFVGQSNSSILKPLIVFFSPSKMIDSILNH